MFGKMYFCGMKSRKFILLSLCLFMAFSGLMHASDNVVVATDTVYVAISPERLDVYPPQYIKELKQTSRRLTITTTDDEEHVYRLSLIDSVSNSFDKSLIPSITLLKFNNKYNDQVFSDTTATIKGDSLITISVPAIGKWLTPSFRVTDEDIDCVYDQDGALVYSQTVKHPACSRRRFDKSVYYTATRSGWQIIGAVASDDPEEEEPEPVNPGDDGEIVTQVALTASMLSTNAPSNYGEDPANLLDGDLSTMFHSTWGSGIYEKLPAGVCPYLDVALPEPLHDLQFSYTTREVSDRHTTGLRLYASNDGNTWTAIRDFDVDADKLPTTTLEEYRSPTVDLKGNFSYLRFEQTSCAYKNNYLAWMEFSLYKVTYPDPVEPEPTPEDPEEEDPQEPQELQWRPFGRLYRVSVDWPADRATITPTISVETDGLVNVTSKDYYLDAYITIDGAGLFPDMNSTYVQIKGRGNSSWTTPSYWDNPKNPYRLKFEISQKPFGMKKGKNWVLQAQSQTGSMMVNAIGMKAGHLMGAVASNHVVPVEFYLNNEYRGSYIFNEKIGFHNNSIDLENEDRAFRLELDAYYETGQFRTTYYYMPVNIKEPEFDNEDVYTELKLQDVKDDVNAFMKAVYNEENISAWVDVEYLASFLSVNELVGNYELMHPKSTFLFKEDLFGDSKYIFGPVWDLDWAYGYETNHNYCTTGSTDDFYSNPRHTFSGGTNANGADQFWKHLRYSEESVDRAYYKLWTRFMTQNGIDELIDFCDDYFNYANPSFLNNAKKWSDGSNYSSNKETAKKWLRQRAEYIYSKLTPYDLTGELDESIEWEPSVAGIDNDDPEEADAIDAVTTEPRKPTVFTVYDLRGVLLKRNASFNTWRNGLAPGIYIVNGKKVLVD